MSCRVASGMSPWPQPALIGTVFFAATVAALPLCAAPPPRLPTADIAALTVCLIKADMAAAAIEQMLAGRDETEVQDAADRTLADPAYRGSAQRVIAEVYRAHPAAPRPYIAALLESCVGKASRRARTAQADACYQLTRYVKDIYRARDSGLPLADAAAALQAAFERDGRPAAMAERLNRMAQAIYESASGVAQFRTALFVECVAPH